MGSEKLKKGDVFPSAGVFGEGQSWVSVAKGAAAPSAGFFCKGSVSYQAEIKKDESGTVSASGPLGVAIGGLALLGVIGYILRDAVKASTLLGPPAVRSAEE